MLATGLGGLAFGLGCASKWTGIYAGAGLAVLYLGVLYARWKQHKPGFWREFRTAALGGVMFYVLLPFVIYLASYLPYLWRDPDFGLKDWWDCQQYMFWYHSTLEATHPFESRWYTWLLGLRPVWYYQNTHLEPGLKASIAGLGGPVIWLAGLAAVLLLYWRQCSGRGTRTGAGVLILYATQLVPWMLVARCTFLYHYFPSSIFCLAAIVLVLGAPATRNWPGASVWGWWRFRWCSLCSTIRRCPACRCPKPGPTPWKSFQASVSIKQKDSPCLRAGTFLCFRNLFLIVNTGGGLLAA